jgi:hypothetical protein
MPQSAMGLGMSVLCIAILHSLVETIKRGESVISASEEA